MSEAIKTMQIKPLGSGVPVWDYDTSDYADRIMMPMEDGHVITYVREIRQPHPKCLKTVEMIRIMKGNTFGGSKRRNRK